MKGQNRGRKFRRDPATGSKAQIDEQGRDSFDCTMCDIIRGTCAIFVRWLLIFSCQPTLSLRSSHLFL